MSTIAQTPIQSIDGPTTEEAKSILNQPDISTIKGKMKATWEDGDYATFARFMEAGAIEVINGWSIEPGQHLLDVACGSGQTALPAARLGAKVTGIDLAQNLVDHAKERARAEGLDAKFDQGDAEQLPYAEASFDVIITMFGAMFAPRPGKVVEELARVCKPGGRIIMANWTSDSMPAQMFRCVSNYTPPPKGVVPPVLWGDEDTVVSRLGNDFKNIKLTRRLYPQWHYPFAAAGVVELFRSCFGPVKRAFESVSEDSQLILFEQLEEIYQRNSQVEDGRLTITNGEYLEVIATRC